VKSHTFQTLMRRLSRTGFKADFIRSAILPDWWDESCADDPGVLSDLEIRIARFLRRSIDDIRDPSVALAVPTYVRAQLRRVRDIDRDRLGPAIHAALQIAGAVVRSLRPSDRSPATVPADALVWRHQVSRSGQAVKLDDLLSDLWGRGIPVVPIDVLPVPTFQGLACIVEGRPVLLLGHKIDQPGQVAYVVAHEVGHVVAGDCAPDQPVVDEEEEIADDSEMERKADLFATRVLVGRDDVPRIDDGDFRELARRADALEREIGAEASTIIFAWARRTGEYTMASMAVKALYKNKGARKRLRDHFDRHVDIDTATDTDRSLLSCINRNGEDSVAAD
jgi:Zn-dependent peptidase ImmA (M78 family)